MFLKSVLLNLRGNFLIMSNKDHLQPSSAKPASIARTIPVSAGNLIAGGSVSADHIIPHFRSLSHLSGISDPLSHAVFSPKTNLLAKNISDLKNPVLLSSNYKSLADNSLGEKLFNASSQIKILTSQVAMHIDTKYRERLFSQIDSLHDLDEWDPDDKPIQVTSFKTFLKTIVHLQPKQYPSLGLSYTGNLMGAWVKGKDRLTIEFLPNDIVKWVFSKSINNAIVRSATQAPLELLLEGLAPYHPNDWFF